MFCSTLELKALNWSRHRRLNPVNTVMNRVFYHMNYAALAGADGLEPASLVLETSSLATSLRPCVPLRLSMSNKKPATQAGR